MSQAGSKDLVPAPSSRAQALPGQGCGRLLQPAVRQACHSASDASQVTPEASRAGVCSRILHRSRASSVAGPVPQQRFDITTVRSGHEAGLCPHCSPTDAVHCRGAEVNLINIGTFNFYVQSKELLHAHFGHSKEMIARKIIPPGQFGAISFPGRGRVMPAATQLPFVGCARSSVSCQRLKDPLG